MERHEELLNVYDASGKVIDALPRRQAKASGLAVGAVNVLAVNSSGRVLLQRRPRDKENGGLWDKSVGGHVSAGEEFDRTAVRESGEELFDDPSSPRVRLARSEEEFLSLLATEPLGDRVLLKGVGVERNIRDVRHAPGGGLRNVIYHVAMYVARTEIPEEGFSPQAAEIDELRYFHPRDVDRMLLESRLAPNMSLLWLLRAQGLLSLPGVRRPPDPD